MRLKRMRWGSLLILAGLLAVLSAGMLVQTYLGAVAPAASWPEGERVWVVDPGHGGEDGGAVSVTGVPESQINLAIAKRLDALLGFYGENSYLMREEDISLHDPEAETLREKKVSDLHNRAEDYQRRYHVQEVEQAPDKETYLYYSTQRPIDIGTYPNSYFNRPVHMDLYFTRQQVTGEAFQAWGAITYAHPLTEREMQDYELRPSRNNLDIRRQMDAQAQVVGQLSASYLENGRYLDMEELQHEEDFQRLASFAATVSEVDFLICDTTGSVLLTTDADLAGKTVVVPEDITQTVLGSERLYEGRSTVGVYEKKQFVVGVPMTDADGNTLGLVLAVMNSAELMQMWRSFIALFFMTSAIILLLAFVASFVTSMRQIQPLTEMVKATRAYAGGDFDVRMQETGDCGEISELAAAFNAMADSLQETERQRRDFIANVSHELKTPMTTIAGYTDGILDGTIPPEKERKYLQIISDESRRLSRLVRRMLDISQIQSQEMKKEDFDLCESMRLALLSMEQKITDRELDVEADIPEEPVMVEGVNDLITQVIYNLLENATKFAAPHSSLYLGLAVHGEKAVVTVRNVGQTIPAEEIPLLFERFHKSDKSRSEDKDGYGLGLYVVKTILSQHKEQITVTSENGVTAFSFTVQMAPPMRNEP